MNDVTIFGYGFSGSGKAYTLVGRNNDDSFNNGLVKNSIIYLNKKVRMLLNQWTDHYSKIILKPGNKELNFGRKRRAYKKCRWHFIL